jgi:hypothetical protein
LGSEYQERRIQCCFGRTIQFCGVTKLGCRNGAATWAAKDLPARLLAGQVAKLLNCTTDDVAILVSAGKLRALGRPKPNAVKFFSSIELITLLADPDWLDDATKTIGQYWRRKNARRNGLTLENQADAASVNSLGPVKKPSTKVPVNCLDN